MLKTNSSLIAHQMASNLFNFPIQTIIKTRKKSSTSSLTTKTLFPFFPIHLHYQEQQQLLLHYHFSLFPHKSKIPSPSLSLQCSLTPYTPPKTKEEAILQAKTCLSTTLEKPLNNPRLTGKLKKQKQPRFRIEIPVVDDSAESQTQLAFEIFGDLSIRRKGNPAKILLLWPNPTLTDLANKTFSSYSVSVSNKDVSSVTNDNSRILNSAEVLVFLAPKASQLAVIKAVSDSLYPRPVLVFNPKWAFEDESGFGELSGFVGSFEVVYSFMGLEVKGVLSKRKGVVFKCVKDGVFSGERWEVLVEEEDGEMKVVSRFKKRPLIGEVENALYNLMAVNSPITKSAKFIRDLVSNVTRKR